MNITRRVFLRYLGFTLGGLVLAACSRRPRSDKTPTPDSTMTCYEPTQVITATPTPEPMMTCYLPAGPDIPTATRRPASTRTRTPTATPTRPASSGTPTPAPAAQIDQLHALHSLHSQARLLDGLPAETALDPATVARVRAALSRDAAAVAPRGLAALLARLLGWPT